MITVNDLTFDFLAYLDSSFVPNSYGAENNNSGSPFMDLTRLEENIIQLKKS